ncbi:hypothetical protein [Nonlabens ulvanivorans]|uniref:Uncharacterized protein n=2 Tax=Nonlabens ulvanivorans TaxID=906888 RepID=A0A090WJK1_NONUL|nr:hypothetical protein [Nonlabens ulvanivorans]GAL76393.1 hypothetical protein JCM19275_802 [Nonlabens ulvanivorans]
MSITTNSIEKRLFNVWMNKSLIVEFEQWVYQSEELKEYLSANAYFDFLDLNYKSETAYHDLKNLISKEISISQLETWSLLHQLDCVKQRRGDYYNIIENLYNLGYYGYTFMDKFSYDYCLNLRYPHNRYSNNNEFIDSFYPSILKDIDEVEQWILNKLVIPLGGKMEFEGLKFIDNRVL